MNSSHGNEVCSWTTSSSLAGNGGRSGNGVPTGAPPNTVCDISITGGGFVSGDISLNAEARDVCNPSPAAIPIGATTSTDWVIDPASADGGLTLGATHAPGSHFSRTPLVQNLTLPQSWLGPHGNGTLDFDRPLDVLDPYPVVFEVPKATPGPHNYLKQSNSSGLTSYSNNQTAWDEFLAGRSCTYSQGFCARTWGPCGQQEYSRNSTPPGGTAAYYARKGRTGASCWQVECENTLSCIQAGDNRGTCGGLDSINNQINCDGGTSRWKCISHSECDSTQGNECRDPVSGEPVPWNNQDLPNPKVGHCMDASRQPTPRICGNGNDGDCETENGGIGRCVFNRCRCASTAPIGYIPGKQDRKDIDCPDEFGSACGGVHPQCACDDAIAAAHCPTYTFTNDCGIPNSCRGNNISLCPKSNVTPILAVQCRLNTTRWLGARTDQTIFEFWDNADWATGGFPQYSYQCSTVSEDGPWGSCNYGNWPQSPIKTNSPNLPYWVKAIDSRSDFEICTGFYKLDRTPPTFPVTSEIKPGTCGSLATPTLSTDVVVSFRADDAHTATLVSASNITYNSATSDCQNSDWSNGTCVQIKAPVNGDPARDSAQKIRITARDEALNSTTQTIDAFAAVRGGITHSFNEGASSASFSRKGCQGCTEAPYNQPLVDTIRDANALNFHNSMTLHRRLQYVGGPAPTNDTIPVAQFPAPARAKTDYRFTDSRTRTIQYYFEDSCSNRSATFSAGIFLDWAAPNIDYLCDPGIGGIDISVSEPGTASGFQRLWGRCENPGTGGAVNFNQTSPSRSIGLDPGTNTCTISASDVAGPRVTSSLGNQVGNNSEDKDGSGLVTTVITTCNIPTTTTTLQCMGHAGHQTSCNAGWPSCILHEECACYYDGGVTTTTLSCRPAGWSVTRNCTIPCGEPPPVGGASPEFCEFPQPPECCQAGSSLEWIVGCTPGHYCDPYYTHSETETDRLYAIINWLGEALLPPAVAMCDTSTGGPAHPIHLTVGWACQ